MTQQEKLQQLFDAALRSPVEPGHPSASIAVPVPKATPAVATPATTQVETTSPVVAETLPPAAQISAVEPLVKPMDNAGLDHATSTELGTMLDEQRARLKRQRVRQTIITLAACVALCGGAVGWFVQSPGRMQALNEAMRDIRSVGDVKGLVGKYKAALDRIAQRSNQVDEATASLGVKASPKDEVDPYMDAEMKQMMGGKGKTVGERTRAMTASFSHMKNEADAAPTQPVSNSGSR